MNLLDLGSIARMLNSYGNVVLDKAFDEESHKARYEGQAEYHQVQANYYAVKMAQYEDFGEGWELEKKLAECDRERHLIQRDHWSDKAENEEE